MLHRFTGPDGKVRLADALLRQHPVQGNQTVADELAAAAELHVIPAGTSFIEQDGTDNDIYFILDGRTSVRVNGRHVADRSSGQHIGEMALIDPVGRRVAAVVAVTETTVAKVDALQFIPIADRHPAVWRRQAIELVERLRQRGANIRAPNSEPRVFVGSSVEGLPVLNAIQAGLSHLRAVVEPWTQNVFTPSAGTMEALEKKVETSDFAVLVATADDAATMRGKDVNVARDNVVFELGLFMGALGRPRTVFVTPRGADLHIPSDLLGITPLTYQVPTNLADLPAKLGPVCIEIAKLVETMGPR